MEPFEIIRNLVNRETRSWNEKNVDSLISIFHPDMVWPWPISPDNHDPATWSMGFGRYNYERWRQNWQSLFDDFELVHNNRDLITIKVSDEKDGGFAVVDIDTLWRHKVTGEEDHWLGRVCKIYTKVDEDWKMIAHTGVLKYSN